MKFVMRYLGIAVILLSGFSLYGCSGEDNVIPCVKGNDTLFPDCNNCTRYWQCANGKAVHMTCPEKLWFNYIEEECDYISRYPLLHGCGDVRCNGDTARMGKKYALKDDEKKFIWCISGTAYVYTCCEDNEKCHFDEPTQNCIIEDNSASKKVIVKIVHLDEKPSQNVCRSAPLLLI